MASRACAPMASPCQNATARLPPAALAPAASLVVLVASPAAPVAQAALAVQRAALAVRPLAVVPVVPVVRLAEPAPPAVVAVPRLRVVRRLEFSTDLILSPSKDEVVARSRHALVVRQAHHEGY